MATDTIHAVALLGDPPGPRGWRLFDSLLEIRRDRISFVEKAAAQFGDFVAFRMGPKRLFLLRSPDLFRHVLVEHPERYAKGPGLDEARPFLGMGLLTTEGCEWRDDRAKLEGAMHARNLDGYAAIIDELAQEFLDRIAERARQGEIFDASAEMALLTLRIVGRTLFGWDFGNQAAIEIAADLHTLTQWAMEQMMGVVALPLWTRPGPSAALRRLRRWADEILAKIRLGKSGSGAGDALSQMLASGGASRARDHVITFLLAGHETTALTLSWAIALLAGDKEAAASLRQESGNQEIGRRTWANAQSLEFTRQVVEETLRLYPPVWLLPRKSIADDRLGGYEIPAGSGVLLCVYLLHRHPAFWKQPLEFLPKRFSRQQAGTKPPGCYLPFGLGSRACIGSRFGLMESTLILSALASRFRWEAAWTGELRPAGSLSLQPSGGVPVRFFEAHE
jgi:cytochrome P450